MSESTREIALNRELAAQGQRIRALAGVIANLRKELETVRDDVEEMRTTILRQQIILRMILGVSAVITPILSAIIIEFVKYLWR